LYYYIDRTPWEVSLHFAVNSSGHVEYPS